jgi:1-acyl-sn-glycerol-3-phosphate acyltransferase
VAAVGSVAYWLFVCVVAIVMFPIAVLVWLATVAFDRRLVVLHALTSLWASLYTWGNPLWRVRVQGRDKIRPGRAYVMIANHNSMVDIFVLHRLFVHFKWVSKIEVFRIPSIGWAMRLNRYIALRRGDRQSVIAMLAACEHALAEGNSVMMFPEGTRSKDGNLRPFKPGAFTLAQRAKVPLLPIIVRGTARALPKHGFLIGRSDMHVLVLDEIPHHTFADEDPQALADRIREHFIQALD